MELGFLAIQLTNSINLVDTDKNVSNLGSFICRALVKWKRKAT